MQACGVRGKFFLVWGVGEAVGTVDTCGGDGYNTLVWSEYGEFCEHREHSISFVVSRCSWRSLLRVRGHPLQVTDAVVGIEASQCQVVIRLFSESWFLPLSTCRFQLCQLL